MKFFFVYLLVDVLDDMVEFGWGLLEELLLKF